MFIQPEFNWVMEHGSYVLIHKNHKFCVYNSSLQKCIVAYYFPLNLIVDSEIIHKSNSYRLSIDFCEQFIQNNPDLFKE